MWSLISAVTDVILVPFEALGHQVCLVGIHDEGELIDEVFWLNETLEPAHHGHLTVLQHDHGQEWVGVLPQCLGHWNTTKRVNVTIL